MQGSQEGARQRGSVKKLCSRCGQHPRRSETQRDCRECHRVSNRRSRNQRMQRLHGILYYLIKENARLKMFHAKHADQGSPL